MIYFLRVTGCRSWSGATEEVQGKCSGGCFRSRTASGEMAVLPSHGKTVLLQLWHDSFHLCNLGSDFNSIDRIIAPALNTQLCSSAFPFHVLLGSLHTTQALDPGSTSFLPMCEHFRMGQTFLTSACQRPTHSWVPFIHQPPLILLLTRSLHTTDGFCCLLSVFPRSNF